MLNLFTTKKAVIARGGIGGLLRMFEEDPKRIKEKILITEKIINNLFDINVDGLQAIKSVVLLVWSDKRYKMSDCGETAKALKQHFKNDQKRIKILEINEGGIYCDCLNQGLKYLDEVGRCAFALILSAEASSYCNSETINDMVGALSTGALATGAAINEIYQSVLEGRISNSFSIWHIKSLRSVGGFDPKFEMPTDLDNADWKRGLDEKTKKFLWYPNTGVEEIIPLIKLLEKYQKKLIAPIIPFDAKNKKFEASNDHQIKRIMAMFAAKTSRQLSRANYAGRDLSFIKDGVMDEYRHF